MRNPTTVAEVVADIIANMTDGHKELVVRMPENGLIIFHHGWGTRIRNDYNLWQNTALVKAAGAAHPDDASMLIIKAVWQALRDAETSRYPRNEILADGEIPGPPTSGNSEDY